MEIKPTQENPPNFYVLHATFYRGGWVCHDAGTWTHASTDFSLLAKFIEEITHPNDGNFMTILKIKVQKYIQIYDGELFQGERIWEGGSLHEESDLKNYCSFNVINDEIMAYHHFERENDHDGMLDHGKRLKDAFKRVWKEIEESLNSPPSTNEILDFGAPQK